MNPAVASSVTPDRRRPSWRRTSSVDMARPEGPDGPLVLDCRGRDLFTDPSGHYGTTDAVTFQIVIDYTGRGTIDSVTGPRVLAPLVGASVVSGFRRMVSDRLASLRPGSLVALLLDEVPVVTMISRAALSDRAMIGIAGQGSPVLFGICSGWRDGGRLATAVITTGQLPVIERPAAPDLRRADDPDAWHAWPETMGPQTMRRLRRFDLADLDAPTVTVDSFMRDSMAHIEQGHVVVHEYGVTASFDRAAGTVATIDAQAHVLPGPECPVATTSADRLVGRPVAELRDLVRQEFTGISTCTHLNDHLRALGDLSRLLDLDQPD